MDFLIKVLIKFLSSKGIKEEDMDVSTPEIKQIYDEKEFVIDNKDGTADIAIGLYHKKAILLNVNEIISGQSGLNWEQVVAHETCHHLLNKAGLDFNTEEELCKMAENIIRKEK